MNPSVERFTGFAQVYDQVRPSPPEAIADLLLQFAKLETAERVVDLGCGSGLINDDVGWEDTIDHGGGTVPGYAARSRKTLF
jgi:predicted TPR repeat methyltransferase